MSDFWDYIHALNYSDDPCWKRPGHEMREWAERWELTKGNQGHGLGTLTQPCEFRKGEVCPACDKRF
jgi:hypothetical protein